MRVVHYINQFFGGIGGEELADAPLEVRPGPVGPGRLLDQLLGEDSKVVSTIVCGDNLAAENLEKVAAAVISEVKASGADLLLAGPCFQAGRYGTAAGAVCSVVQEELGISAVTAMSVENPGVDLYRASAYIIDSGDDVSRMQPTLAAMFRLGKKLSAGEKIGRPTDEGYIPQGTLKSEFVEKSAASRLAGMLLAKMRGESFEAEVPIQAAEPVPVPPAVADLSQAKVALVTDGGLVPKGNPHQFPLAFSRVWGAYSFAGENALSPDDYEVSHGGYDNRHVEQDPHRLVPVDTLREMERDGDIGKLHEEFLSTTGNGNPLANSRRIGREMARRLKDSGVDTVVLTST